MGEDKDLVQISMVRPDLDNLPRYDPPPGYGFRRYRPGDEQTWVDIEGRADKHHEATLKLFQEQFGTDPEKLTERMYFLCGPDGAAIGTASAWYDENYHGRPHGRVHWVAIVPAMQGRGLAKPLLSVVCDRLRQLGHARAVLGTQTYRIPAICLYLKFGFVPDIRGDRDLRAWGIVQGNLPPDRREQLRLDARAAGPAADRDNVPPGPPPARESSQSSR